MYALSDHETPRETTQMVVPRGMLVSTGTIITVQENMVE